MKSEQEEKFKKILIEEEKIVSNQLKSIAVQNSSDLNDWIPKIDLDSDGLAGEGEDAVQTTIYQERVGLVAGLETRYNNIKKALDSINNGTYGVCLLCGKKIELDRLNANPAAKTCKEHVDKEVDVI